jgi:hypothetical protein
MARRPRQFWTYRPDDHLTQPLDTPDDLSCKACQ